VRFLFVALAGFAVDSAVVWSLINFYAVPEQLACIIGFALATAGCFFAHTREELPIPVRLAIAGGIAFVLAYLLSNRLVFRAGSSV